MCLAADRDPHGAYAAVIPLFVKEVHGLESPVINGSGDYSRDFTYVENVIEDEPSGNRKRKSGSSKSRFITQHAESVRALMILHETLRTLLSKYDPAISEVEILHGPERLGDIPHSLASIDKAKELLGYQPLYMFSQGLEKAVDWYWNNLKIEKCVKRISVHVKCINILRHYI